MKKFIQTIFILLILFAGLLVYTYKGHIIRSEARQARRRARREKREAYQIDSDQ